MEVIVITWEEWFEQFGDNISIEDFDADIVNMNRPSKHIWTLVDTDEYPVVVNGWHYVNRLGYYITQKPWDDDSGTIIVRDDV